MRGAFETAEKTHSDLGTGRPFTGRNREDFYPMDMSELKELIDVFENSSVTEMDYEHGDLRVRLKRNPTGEIVVLQDTVANGAAVAAPTMIQVAPQTAAAPAADTSADDDDDNLVSIDAPFVGIFYLGSAPDTEPYVTIDQKIEVGQTVAIISAMKVMNEIKSEVAGTIREILVEDGQAIEFGQSLFNVEPAPAAMEG